MRPAQWRLLGGAVAVLLLAVVAVTYVVRAGNDARTAKGTGGSTPPGDSRAATPGAGLLDAPGILFVDNSPGVDYGRLATVPRGSAAGPRRRYDVACHRAFTAGGRVICLHETSDFLGDYEALIMDLGLRTLATYPLAGVPSRARLSADGRIAAWTVFVQGDSYAPGKFSTRTSILDLTSGKLESNLEDFSVVRDGKPYRAADINVWGVTVAADDRTFYATMATAGRTYLVKGDLATRSLRTLRTNVECPSLSPDGTRLAFKKRVQPDGGAQPWRLSVLDLASMTETPLAERRSVDDQALWLDDETVAYAVLTDGIGVHSIWHTPASGQGRPSLLLELGSSPTVVPPTIVPNTGT